MERNRMKKTWDYDYLIPLFEESGLGNLDGFKKVIRRLEKEMTE
jgi:hypothetical protein